MTQSLTILGSTGSIGTSTLDVVARHPERFRIFALSGHSQTAKLAEQCLAFRPQYAVTANEAQAAALRTHRRPAAHAGRRPRRQNHLPGQQRNAGGFR